MRCHSYRFISIIRFENFMDFLFIFFMHRSETSKQRNRLMKKKSPLNFCIFLSLNFRATDYLLLILFFMAFHISNRMVLLNEGKKMNGLQQSRTIITNAALWKRLSEWNGLNEFGFMMQKDAITILYFHGLWWIACFFSLLASFTFEILVHSYYFCFGLKYMNFLGIWNSLEFIPFNTHGRIHLMPFYFQKTSV